MHIEEVSKRIIKMLNGKKQDPVKVDVFFTEACNLKCKFCNYSKIPLSILKKEMKDEKILKLIDEICELKVKIFGVLGGEPFMRKKVLLESMERIKENGIAGSLVTNGTLISSKDIERIIKMEWDLIRFSIDGLEKTHDYLRGRKGSFRKVMQTLKKFYELKKKLKSNFPTLEVNFVLTNRNYKELKDLIKKVSKFGVNFVYVLPLIELTPESKKLKITNPEKVNKWLEKAKVESTKLGIKTNLDEIIKRNLYLYSNRMEKIIIEKNSRLPACFLPWYTINITSDGIATPCAQWPKEEGIPINKPLKEIWFKDFEKFREKMRKHLFEWCSRCCVPLVDENKEIKKLIEKHVRKSKKN